MKETSNKRKLMKTYIIEVLQYTCKDIIAQLPLLPYGIITGLVGLVLFLILSRINPSIKKHIKSATAIALLIGYGIILCYITLFTREPGSREGVDLRLFGTMGHGAQGDAYVLENILVFIPLGILVTVALPTFHKWWYCTLLGLLISCGIEMTQYITCRGYAQLDDVVTNTIGMLLGYFIAQSKIAKSIMQWKNKRSIDGEDCRTIGK